MQLVFALDTQGSHHRSKKFPIPESRFTLIITEGEKLDPRPLSSVLVVAAAYVDEQEKKHGGNAPGDHEVDYDLGEGIIIHVESLDIMSWNELDTVFRGLKLYEIEAKRYRQCYFEIFEGDDASIHRNLGRGWISPVPQSSPKLLLETFPPNPSQTVSAGALAVSPSPVETARIFQIPRSDLVLRLSPRGGLSGQSIDAILLTSDTWVSRKISIYGADTPMIDPIFQYGTGDRPYTRLIVWSALEVHMTWGQLKTVIDGPWQYLVEEYYPEYTYWEIYQTRVSRGSLLGYGALLELNANQPHLIQSSTNSTTNSTSTSKRSLELSPLTPPPPPDLTTNPTTLASA